MNLALQELPRHKEVITHRGLLASQDRRHLARAQALDFSQQEGKALPLTEAGSQITQNVQHFAPEDCLEIRAAANQSHQVMANWLCLLTPHLSRSQQIDSQVRRDAIDPGIDAETAVVPSTVLPHAQKSQLDNVLRFFPVPDYAEGKSQERLGLSPNELLECRLITAHNLSHQLAIVEIGDTAGTLAWHKLRHTSTGCYGLRDHFI